MMSKCKAYLFYSEINRPEPLRSSIQMPIPYSCVNSAYWYFCFWLFDLYSYFYHLLCMSRIYLYNNLNTELVKGHNFLLILLNHTKPRLKLCKTIGFLNVQYSDTIQTPAVDYFTHCCNCRSTLIHLFVIITGPAFRYYCSLFWAYLLSM